MGPLHGVKAIELTGIGPCPFAATLLSDMGADVVRIDRADWVDRLQRSYGFLVDGRGRRSLGVDLKHPDGVATVLSTITGTPCLWAIVAIASTSVRAFASKTHS